MQIKSVMTALNLLIATVLGILVMATFMGPIDVEPMGTPTCPNPHNPILIDGNADFTAANGVTGGSGTLFDPYKIEGWTIDASTSVNGGIAILNTDAHFIVSNVCVLSGALNPPTIDNPGITFSNVKYGFLHNSLSDLNAYGLKIDDSQFIGVESNVLTANGGASGRPSLWIHGSDNILVSQNEVHPAGMLPIGIAIAESTEVEVKSNTVIGSYEGIGVSDSIDILVEGNVAKSCMEGVYVTDSRDILVISNTAFNTSVHAIDIFNGSNITISGNIGGGGSTGVHAGGGVTDLVVQGNEMYENGFTGISVTADHPLIIENKVHDNMDGIIVVGDGALIFGNDASHNEVNGIWLMGSTNATVIGNTVSYNDMKTYSKGICVCNAATGTILHHNNIIANTVQAWDLMGPENVWHNGYPSGGNYWSNYSGVDNMNGPNQDKPGSDGIGDTPFVIDSDSQDPYPRMNQIPPFPLDIGTDITVDEGETITLTASAGGLSEPDIHVTWDFRDDVDGDNDGNPINDVDATGLSISHTYGDDGIFAVTATASYFSSYTDMDQMEVTVDNIEPEILGDIEIEFEVNITLRIAGEKWHDVTLSVFEGNSQVGMTTVVREPGSPDDQSVTLHNMAIDVGTGNALVEYTPMNDPVNGEIWGATPAWLNITFEDGAVILLNHTFNVRHVDTWIWEIPSFGPYLVGVPLTFQATASDPGSDDLTFKWSWGDSSPDDVNVYYNDGINPDPYPSPEVNPMSVTDSVKHAFSSQGTFSITLTVEDDDGGQDSALVSLTL